MQSPAANLQQPNLFGGLASRPPLMLGPPLMQQPVKMEGQQSAPAEEPSGANVAQVTALLHALLTYHVKKPHGFKL